MIAERSGDHPRALIHGLILPEHPSTDAQRKNADGQSLNS